MSAPSSSLSSAPFPKNSISRWCHYLTNIFRSSNGVRGVINLPESTSSDIRVLVIAPPDLVETALKSGAHIAGGAELIQDIIAGKLKFNRCISTPAMMPVLTKAARYLGPLGLMPTIKNGTLTTDISAAIRMAVSNVPFKIDRKAGVMHVKVGKLASFNQEMLQRNVEKVFEVISPFGASLKRGKFIESAHLCVPAEKALRFSPPLADKK